jgi:hypothetical protein
MKRLILIIHIINATMIVDESTENGRAIKHKLVVYKPLIGPVQMKSLVRTDKVHSLIYRQSNQTFNTIRDF